MRGPTRMLLVVIFAGVLATVACSSTEPSQRAFLQADDGLEFNCGLNCSYEGEADNRGTGCAHRVRGITRLHDGAGREIARDDWSLDPARRIGPGETFLFQGCCFTIQDVNASRSSQTQISWDDIAC